MNAEVTTSMTSKAKEQSGTARNGFSPISDEKLLTLYATMRKCRLLEERVSTLCKQGAGSFHASRGQEAAAVGTIVDLLPEDAIGPLHGDFIASFIKGMPLDALLGEISGRAIKPGKKPSAPAHLSYAPLNIVNPLLTTEAQLNIATGTALANKVKGRGNIVVAFLEAESTAEDFWHEAMNFAGTQGLPIVFVCENGLGTEQAKVEDLAQQSLAYGIPGMTVDGNDVVAVYRVAAEAITHARMGHGPTLIECTHYRLPGKPELGRGMSDDPILNMEKYLAGKGLFRKEIGLRIDAGFKKKLDTAEKLLTY